MHPWYKRQFYSMSGDTRDGITTLPLTRILKLEKSCALKSLMVLELVCAQQRKTCFGCVPVSEEICEEKYLISLFYMLHHTYYVT